MPRTVSAPVVLVATGRAVLLALCFANSQAIHAADLRMPSSMQVAAVAIDGDLAPASKRRTHVDEVMQIEQLLAQSTSSAAVEEVGETVLAGFPMSAPESVEEEVAKAHNLEIVRRVTIEAIDRRIVVLRHKDNRSADDVVAVLKTDSRVTSAQLNVRYGLPHRGPAPGAISSVKPPADSTAKPAKTHAAEPDRKVPSPPAEAKAGARAPVGEAAPAARPAAPPMRSAQRQGPLVASKQAGLRWPTADEPFVSVGVTNK